MFIGVQQADGHQTCDCSVDFLILACLQRLLVFEIVRVDNAVHHAVGIDGIVVEGDTRRVCIYKHLKRLYWQIKRAVCLLVWCEHIVPSLEGHQYVCQILCLVGVEAYLHDLQRPAPLPDVLGYL